MGKCERCRTVLVLTDKPEDYREEMERLGLAPLFAANVPALLDHLLDEPTSGFVLEVQKVMRAQGAERDHLFKVAGAFPLLRVRRRASKGVVYIDDRDHFLNRVRLFSPRKVRCHVRVAVRLNALLAEPDDADFARAVPVNLLDISRSGGFLYTQEDFAPGREVLLRILELADQTAIRAHVRWRRPWGHPDTLPGIGLLFESLRPTQKQELDERYLAPAAAAQRRK